MERIIFRSKALLKESMVKGNKSASYGLFGTANIVFRMGRTYMEKACERIMTKPKLR